MKILLVRPISNTYIITPPIGLGYLATALQKRGHNVDILDCVKQRMNLKNFASFVKRYKPDVVGIQVWSCDVPNVLKSLQIIKSIDPDIITIIGGAHPSGISEEVLDYFVETDFAFKGEGEYGLPLLLDALVHKRNSDLYKIPGLIWRKNGSVETNSPVFIDDLDSFGFPAWNLIPPNSYPMAPHQGFMKAFPIAPIIVTRGCPYACTFCATHSINGKKIRSRSIDSVIEEIKQLHYNYNVKEIHIEDDNFTMNKDFVKEFCRRLLKEDIKIFWYCSSGIRLDSLDRETLILMKASNCYTITVAIESGSQRVLRLMKKNLTSGKIKEGISLMNSVGYRPTGLFMLGFPGETKEDIRQTLRLAMGSNLKRAQFAIFHPLPGSEIFDELKKRGELDNLDWGKLKPSKVAYESSELSAEELKKIQRTAFLKFHLRPKILYYQLKELHSFTHFLYLFKRLIDMLFSKG